MKRICIIFLAFELFLSVSILLAQESDLAHAQQLDKQILVLYQQCKYQEAIPLAHEMLTILEKALGAEHPDVAYSLNKLALLYDSIGSFAEAKFFYQRALTIREKVYGLEHTDVAQSLNNLAGLYVSIGSYAKAESLYQRASVIWENNLGPEHPEVARGLNNLANLYLLMGSYAKAESLLKRALEIFENNLGPTHLEVAGSLNDLAGLYHTMGFYAKAEPLYRRALMISEKNLGLEHPDVARTLNNLASLHFSMGSYAKAEPLYRRVLMILKKNLGPEHLDVASTLDNLAGLYHTMGFYAKAESLAQQALAIREKTLGPEHPDVAKSLNNFAEQYRIMGSYANAESLLKRSLAIREKKLGPEHPDVAESLNNLASLYGTMGSYAKAEPLYRRALTIKEKTLGPEHPYVANILNNLGTLYYSVGFYIKAELLFQRALLIQEKKLGSKHPDVATSLNNLAYLYRKMGSYANAESLLKRSLKIEEEALGSEHPKIAYSLNDLGLLYYFLGSYAKAESLYKRALAIREKALGSEHPEVAASLNNLVGLWIAMGKTDSTLFIAKRRESLKFNLYHRILPYLSETRQLEFIMKTPPLYEEVWPSLDFQYGSKYHGIRPWASEVLINNKGLTFEVLATRVHQIKADDKSIASLKDSLNYIKTRLANFYLSNIAPGTSVEQRIKDIQLISEQQQRLEDELASKGYASESRKSPISVSQITKALPEDCVLVDFWYFEEYVFTGENKGWGKPYYLAIVFQSNKNPEFIYLGKAYPIDKSIAELISSILTRDIEKSVSKQQSSEALAKTKGKQLWQQLFKPLLPAIGEKKKVIICTDGLLHYLPFGVMVDEQNRYLVESYQFHYVSTSREILHWQASSKFANGNLNQAVIIADPQFDIAPAQKVASATASKSFELEFSDRHSRDWRQMGFSQLQYTRPEAVAIDSLLKQKGIATKLYLQDQAQESVLKSVASPKILHISTHGFFLPDQPELRKPKEIGGFSSIGMFDRTQVLENPLLRCGLAFAGANHAESVKEGEDGLATAMEIAGLDLQGTDLVTLSACLTGVGELKSGEGVYGLHRSFLLAGAKTVLASLWSVPDLETKDLMVEFYRRYLFGENISKSEALRQAQLAVIEQLRKKYGAAHPAYWGAFVCIGEP